MNVKLSRLRRADRVVAGGAIALFVFMFFFDWLGESVSGTLPGSSLSGANTGSSGWETFTDSRWIWLLTSVVAIVSVAANAGGRRLQTSLQPGAIVMLLGALSALLILYRIFHHPAASASFGGFHASYGIKPGIWLGLIAALAIGGGGYLQLRAEGSPASAPGDPAPQEAFRGLTVSGEAAPVAPPRREPAPPAPPAPGATDAQSPQEPPPAQDGG